MKIRHPRARLGLGVVVALVTAASCRSSGRLQHGYAHSPTAPTYEGRAYVDQPASPATPMPGANASGKAFATREDAMKAVADVCGTGDRAKTEEIFGAGAWEVLESGDATEDRQRALLVRDMIVAKVEFEERGADHAVAAIGNDRWPFPIPLVRGGQGWQFDLEAGKDELLSRRIGRNELATIETMYAYVDAQREYRAKGRDGNAPAYAQKVRSSAGKHDGLFWDAAGGEPQSPFGPLIDEAEAAGYTAPPEGAEPGAFHGYRYRILKAQGANVSGGRKSWVASNGLMTGGFAAIAWPATHGNSGVMTFVVSQSGIVFEKDLGPDTARIAAAMTEYDPDKTWTPAPHPPAHDE